MSPDIDPEEIAVRWSAERAERTRRAIHDALERPARGRRAMWVLSLAAAAALLAVAVVSSRGTSGSPAPLATQGAGDAEQSDDEIHFADGSWARRLSGETDARRARDEERHARVELGRGGVEVEVTRNPERAFEVIAGEVSVVVLGTRFFVEREGERVRVRVVRGRVQVRWPGGEELLSAGDDELFPPPPLPTGPAPEAEAPLEAPTPAEPTSATPAGRWRAQAQEGEFGRAFASLRDEGFATVHNTPEDLMLAADVARLSGHPRNAVQPLRRLIDGHAADARAPLAAFTLGRVLLEDLGDPAGAARAFHRAQTLAPQGPLLGDAMVREAEALAASGDTSASAEIASRYLERFPTGRHVARARTLLAR